ncbi:MAG: winged helix-turn-helix domain-containing protein [Acidobacteria bacterium]|nr:winged helix-turn-helix domain-containing protein [Acidobacteriota bacterium]
MGVTFGEFELDVDARELRAGTSCVRLQEQPFVILQLLLERRGQVVTREELRQRLWPAGTFVDFEHSLNAAVKRLRAALADDADAPRFIETIPRRGYRFVATEDEAEPSPRADGRHRIRIAVLPFSELGDGFQPGYFGHAFTDEMISQLGCRCRGRLGVISSHSSMAFRNATVRAQDIGAALRADYLLEGSIRHSGGRVRITARLVETASETHLWVDTYEEPLTDWLAAQTDIAARIARSLAMELDADEPALSRGTSDPVAHQSYLKARYHWQRIADSGAADALYFFRDAATRDPQFAGAHAGVAIIEAMRATYYHEVPRPALERARLSAERALELDATVADAHFAVGEVRRMLLWDFRGARDAYSRAIALNSSFESARGGYARLLASIGNFGHAVREAELAHELDPRCLTANTITAWVRYLAGDYDAAIDLCRHTLEMDDSHLGARQLLGTALLAAGSRKEALRVLEAGAPAADPHPTTVAVLAYARAVVGDCATSADLLGRLERSASERYVPPYYLAVAYAALGQIDAAFEALRKACDHRDPAVTNVAVDPRLAPLRDDARYAALLRDMGLHDFHRRAPHPDADAVTHSNLAGA